MVEEKTKFLDELAESDQKKTGIISLSDYHQKQKEKTDRQKAVDPLNKYVNHFSNMADMVENLENKGKDGSGVMAFG